MPEGEHLLFHFCQFWNRGEQSRVVINNAVMHHVLRVIFEAIDKGFQSLLGRSAGNETSPRVAFGVEQLVCFA